MLDEQIRPARPFFMGTKPCLRKHGSDSKSIPHRALLLTLAARLTNLLEKLDWQPIETVMSQLNQSERLILAKNIAMINQQHRKVMPVLPCFRFTAELCADGHKLRSINISASGEKHGTDDRLRTILF